MKAAQINDYGTADAIVYTESAERPVPGPGQVLIGVQAAGLNPVDSYMRSGAMRQMVPLKFPVTLGGDFAGVVREVGPGVDTLAVGDDVWGQAIAVGGGSGSIAEFAAANAATTARKPRTIGFVEAASLPLVGVSAIQAVTEHLNVQRGQRILILGAAGGIGIIAVQLVRHLGARVIATALPRDVEALKQFGAHEVIDTNATPFETVVKDVDGVLDTVGGEENAKAYGVVKRGGMLLSMIAPPDSARAAELGITAMTQRTETSSARLAKLTSLVIQGVMRARVDRVFTISATAEAFKFREAGEARGKVVVVIR